MNLNMDNMPKKSKEPRLQGGVLKPKPEIPKQVRDDRMRDPNPVVMLNLFQHLVQFFSAFGRRTFHPRRQDGVFRCDLNKGVTLIELLIALVISGILIAAIYRGFIGQQRVYAVQEQVADMQQNTRVAINKMMREIRMVNMGNVADFLSLPGYSVNGFTQVITPNLNTISIVGGFKQIKDSNGNFITVISTNGNQITLSAATDKFDGARHGYISIGGIATYQVQQPTGNTAVLTLDRTPKVAVGGYVFKVQAITYAVVINAEGKPELRRDENTSPQPNPQPLAENIENLQFKYYDNNNPPNETADPTKIAMIGVTVTARTKDPDPEFKGGVGAEVGGRYRRREVTFNIQLRNMGLPPS
jgi:prepilin-type N-terminal cleavage/methylation domain-containing protein